MKLALLSMSDLTLRVFAFIQENKSIGYGWQKQSCYPMSITEHTVIRRLRCLKGISTSVVWWVGLRQKTHCAILCLKEIAHYNVKIHRHCVAYTTLCITNYN